MAQAAAHSKAKKPKRLSSREFRAQAETLVERLIDLMDELDGDENLEPSLGQHGDTLSPYNQEDWGTGNQSDGEPSLGGWPTWGHALDAEGDPCDQGEPELGWTGGMNQQHASDLLAANVFNSDGESEHDGREPDVDAEDGGDDEPGEGDLDRFGSVEMI